MCLVQTAAILCVDKPAEFFAKVGGASGPVSLSDRRTLSLAILVGKGLRNVVSMLSILSDPGEQRFLDASCMVRFVPLGCLFLPGLPQLAAASPDAQIVHGGGGLDPFTAPGTLSSGQESEESVQTADFIVEVK
ncbi:hypothetical protein NDU88_004248 [Pleurodeles waltl]|uniref:Uncharacterized protein n=1 Tax=Pleurodeles waltl TaxID=8319 RepID=A0AAV7L1D2_PLEWA|nr:hypothetical protein NDU88_004248 [Pleurodeles waltl]